MTKNTLVGFACALLLSSCGTYTGSGAYTGATFGSIIGSAIGGISGGPRGSDIGTLVGMAGGAAVGAAVGAQADKAQQRQYEEYQANRYERRQARQAQVQQRSEMPATGGGDDRLFGMDENFGSSVADPSVDRNVLEIRHARFLDDNGDGVLSRGEEARMVFEVYNNGSKPVFRVQPTVTELTGNRHIRVSENILVESILPGRGIRYTAVIKADSRLRDGEALIRIGVLQNNRAVDSQTQDFPLPTSKR